jgi:hypothetical protein
VPRRPARPERAADPRRLRSHLSAAREPLRGGPCDRGRFAGRSGSRRLATGAGAGHGPERMRSERTFERPSHDFVDCHARCAAERHRSPSRSRFYAWWSRIRWGTGPNQIVSAPSTSIVSPRQQGE